MKISGFWIFLDLKNSTFKYFYRSCKVPPLFLPRCPQRSAQQRMEKQKKLKYFAWILEVSKRGILKI
jgi:hypothetical protein